MLHKPDSALIIVGHGSTLNPDSSAPTWEIAEEIQRRGVFGEVHCAFWKEEPSLRQILHSVDRREVYIVPNFISEGYFTQTVIPRELEISQDDVTVLRDEVVLVDGVVVSEEYSAITSELRTPGVCAKTVKNWRLKYCKPVGSHPRMTELLLKRAAAVAPGVDPHETTLFIVGHGTGLNDNSAVAAKREVAAIAARGLYGQVLAAYMEEVPLIAEWDKLSTLPNVVVVPFFIADGLHSYEDIPVLLGIAAESPGAASVGQHAVFARNPYRLRGHTLYYASSIGTEPGFAETILDQVKLFDALEKYSPEAFEFQSAAAKRQWEKNPRSLANWKRMAEFSLREEQEGMVGRVLRSVDSREPALRGEFMHLEWTSALVEGIGLKLKRHFETCRAKFEAAQQDRTLGAAQMKEELLRFVRALECPEAWIEDAPAPCNSTAHLVNWLAHGGREIGEVCIAALPEGAWEIRHRDDATLADLTLHTRWEDARHLANLDALGAFRPLKTAPNLRRGWRLLVPDVAALRHALEYLYPAMLGVWLAQKAGDLSPVTLRETLGRQTGMYRVTQKLTEPQAQTLIAATCHDGACLKTILWRIAEDQPITSLPLEKFQPSSDPTLPLLCHEACNLLVAAARKTVKGESA
jgi:sirohydrochlorin cobaltochelatase